MLTHEQFLQAVFNYHLGHVSAEDREKLAKVKLTYGLGDDGVRGVTMYGAWRRDGEPVDFIGMNAGAEESPCQLAGTCTHEIGHVLTRGDGHGKLWKEKTASLGLRNPMAAGHTYHMSGFEPGLRHFIASLGPIKDGAPAILGGRTGLLAALLGQPIKLKVRSCGAGRGTRGGTSFGPGSGSRLRKYTCSCEKPVIIRAATDDLAAHCDHCAGPFVKA